MEENKKLFVGHLDWNTKLEDLVAEFSTVGEVDTDNPETKLMTKTDEETQRVMSRGFAFIVMKTPDDAKKVIAEFNGKKVGSMNITVDFARPQEPRTNFGGNRGGFGGGNRGGFGGNRSGGFNRGGDRGGFRGGNRGGSSYGNNSSDDDSYAA